MDAKIVMLFEVHGERDTTEGRGGTYVVGYAETREAAVRLAANRGVMGGLGEVRQIDGVRFADGTLYALGPRCDTAWVKADARARALAKLSPEDRAALGLAAPAPGGTDGGAP